MKDESLQFGRAAAGRPGFASVSLFGSALLGLVIGLFEASLLWTTPRVIPLLVPDVGWVIWFLVPLVDMVFFGLVGLGLGLLGSRTAHKEVFVALEGGIAITFVYLMVKWFHLEIGLHPFLPNAELLVPLLVFAASFVVSLVLISVVWHRISTLAGRWLDKLVRPLAWGLAVATVVALGGIGIFIIRSPASGPAARAEGPPPAGAPNIVFITLDTVRADHLSSYGYSRSTTPNIDRFARTGVLFENAIAPTSWTLASHASMFTGLLPQQHGADWAVPVPSGPWTLAEILHSQGYQTAGFVANNLYLERGWGIAQGFGQYEDYSSYLRPNLAASFLGNVLIQPLYRRFWHFDFFYRENAQQLNTRIVRWFHHRVRRPYFVFINYFDAHLPYLTSRPYSNRFGKHSAETERKLVSALQSGRDSLRLSAGERELLAADYDGCLAYLDHQVAALLKVFRQSPQWQNTIVIITSDHGEEFGSHLSYEHGRNLYREVLRVPLLIAGPGIPRDIRINHLVGTRELFSTVLDLAGHGNTPFSRTSLARFWNHDFKPMPSDNAVLSELVPIYDPEAQRSMMSLTTPQWQYIEHRDGRQELYRWTDDPGEKNNVAGVPGNRATLQELRSRLIHLVSSSTGPWRGVQYLQALDSIAGPARLSLLHPWPLKQDEELNPLPIGIAQAHFKSVEDAPTRPTRAERELMQSLPYQ